MFLLIIALTLGFIVARLGFLPDFLKRNMKLIGNAALCLLLFSMGMSMGSNPEIIAALPSLGAKAFLLAVSSIVGSTLLVWAAVKIATKKNPAFRNQGETNK